jgi:DNA-binding CsgD family transcriptional regulator
MSKLSKETTLSVGFVLFLSIFTAIDIVDDIQNGLPIKHWLHELILVILSVIFIIYKLRLAFIKDEQIAKISNSLVQAQGEVDFYKNKVTAIKSDFSEVVLNQFRLWGLSKGESDIALLLIKGLSMKEIASIRESNEGTVRQQSLAIYKKSHLENRKHLSAYFLDDLFG